jgi:hypothetical protein
MIKITIFKVIQLINQLFNKIIKLFNKFKTKINF